MQDESLNIELLYKVTTVTIKFDLKILENAHKCIPPTPQKKIKNNRYIKKIVQGFIAFGFLLLSCPSLCCQIKEFD